jgi:tripartite-type tricarboxylate transporter receptor subunit TctC
MVHVPYKGSSPAVTDLVGGQVSAAFFVPGNILEFARTDARGSSHRPAPSASPRLRTSRR